MPARTNDFQSVVYFVKKHVAADAEVAESAMLRDRITGELREVDVVISAQVAGQDLAIGIECRDHRRPQSVEWVEQAKDKHSRLPINQTVLVSSSGFTKPAHALAAKFGIELVTPGSEISEQGPLAGLGVQAEAREVSWSGAVRVLASMVGADAQIFQVALAPGARLFAPDGRSLGTVLELVSQIREDLETRPETALAEEDSKWLVFHVDPLEAQHPATADWTSVHLKHRGNGGALLPAIQRIEVAFEIDVRISQIELEFGGLQGAEFATGTGEVAEHKALVVLTESADGPRTSVRVTNRDGQTTDLTDRNVTRVRMTPELRARMMARRAQAPAEDDPIEPA